MTQQYFASGLGPIATYESRGRGRPILLVHGNSLGAEAFQTLFASSLAERYRLLAFDLPGHGASPRASDPERVYDVEAYVRLIREVAEAFCPEAPVLLGHSMGGHLAVQAIAAGLAVAGLATIGSPPLIELASMGRALRPGPAAGLLFKADLTPNELGDFAQALWGLEAPIPEYLSRAIQATDPRARDCMGKSLARAALADEARTIAALPFAAAILIGDRDLTIDADYYRKLSIPNAWKSLPLVMEGSGHCPMLDNPEAFERLVGEYLGGL